MFSPAHSEMCGGAISASQPREKKREVSERRTKPSPSSAPAAPPPPPPHPPPPTRTSCFTASSLLFCGSRAPISHLPSSHSLESARSPELMLSL
ncbi:hypothetical protein P280DRAFT_464365 [Massarina eburnea CBS 473.64]|uniref:Uncharacterized protein n=1 Tax=Massarina eburnea CBS 473.64 TaxID=1395130 RepID=A0A6A6SGQ2_9PLEO|nr:hypothetical protein P280DRAFT_464365 [Massarina eburnea CBS 473.64]